MVTLKNANENKDRLIKKLEADLKAATDEVSTLKSKAGSQGNPDHINALTREKAEKETKISEQIDQINELKESVKKLKAENMRLTTTDANPRSKVYLEKMAEVKNE